MWTCNCYDYVNFGFASYCMVVRVVELLAIHYSVTKRNLSKTKIKEIFCQHFGLKTSLNSHCISYRLICTRAMVFLIFHKVTSEWGEKGEEGGT